MTEWHTSDLHIGHPNCAVKWRGFPTVEAHTDYLIGRFRALVGERDGLVNHGDTGMRSLTARLAAIGQIPGCQSLLMGNHDEIHPCNAGRSGLGPARDRARWAKVFTGGIYTHAEILTDERRVALSHFPYRGGGDHTAAERFTQWRLKDDGGWLLCGHVHAAWLIKDRMINVGVDQWGMGPVPRDVLVGIMDMAAGGATPRVIERYRDKWVQATDGRMPSPWTR